MTRIKPRKPSPGELALNARLAAQEARKQAAKRSYDRSRLFDRTSESLSRGDND